MGDCQKNAIMATFKVVYRVCEVLKKISMHYHQNSGCEQGLKIRVDVSDSTSFTAGTSYSSVVVSIV